jgi:hypothetical protein
MRLNMFRYEPTTEWLERQNKFEREVGEVGLKYISWSVLLGAIDVARIKSGSALLFIAEIVVGGLLWWYLHGQVMRIEINIVPVGKLAQRRYFVVALGIHVLIVSTILIGTTFFSLYVVKALVGVQMPQDGSASRAPLDGV